MAAGSAFLGDASSFAFQQLGLDPAITEAIATNGASLLSNPGVPRTQTRTSHGLVLKVNNRVVGACHGLQQRQARTVEDVWEVDRNSFGTAPVDMVPQAVTERKLTINRYDLYLLNIEDVFNSTGEIIVLSDQFRPFTLRTIWSSPAGILLGGRRVYEYTGCWFSSIGRVARADDARLVGVDAEITYQLRRRVL